MNESNAELKKYQNKLEEMETKLKDSSNSLAEATKKEESMKKEATSQSTYAAALGSVIGSMLWKTSKTEDVINTFINEVRDPRICP